MPVIKIKKKGLPRAQYQNSQVTTTTTAPPAAMTSSSPGGFSGLFLGLTEAVNQIDQNAPAEDVKAGRMADQPYYNPFDVKWGQERVDPGVNIAGDGSSNPLDRLGTSSQEGRLEPSLAYQSKGGRGLLNLPQLVNTNLLSQEKKQETKKEKKPFDFQEFGNKLGSYAKMFRVGLGAADAITSYLEDQKRQKEFDKQLRRSLLPENMYAVSPGGDRGDFDINTGIFQPNKLTPPNVGAAVAQFGGSMSDDQSDAMMIKIRIKSGPSEMKYGGQSEGMALGLDLGQKDVYRHMPKEKSEFARSVIQEVPREEANIEAEKGETVYGDLDNDGASEHFKIGGKRHTEGGTPLSVPEGSFVFSDTKKMIIKNPEILERFGMPPKKEGYTPAQIAKKYDINKFKAIMEDPNSDSIRKSTAQIMMKSYQRKLGELALIQESMKGFPQGIPKVSKEAFPELDEEGRNMLAQQANQDEQVMEQGLSDVDQEQMGEEEYVDEVETDEEEFIPEETEEVEETQSFDFGGTFEELPAYQDAGQVMLTQQELQRKYPWYKPYTESKTKAGRISRTTGATTLFDPSVPSQYNDVDWWVQDAASKGISINNIGDLQKYVYQELEKADPRAIQEMWKKFGPTLKSDERNLQNFMDALAGARTAFAFSKRKPRVTIQAPKPEEEVPTPSREPYSGPGSMAEKVFPKKKAPYAWFTPDVVNMAAAASVAPRKRLPYIAQAAYEPGRLSLEDWRAQAAARQSMYNKVAETLGAYSGGPGLTANLSSMTGQQAEGLAGDIAGVTSRNVDRVNQFLQGERQRKDQFNLLGANRATELYKGNVIANQQYDNAKREYLNNLAKTYGQGFANAMYAGMINAVNPFFQLNPRSGQSFFTGRGFGTGRLGSSPFGTSSGVGLSSIGKLKQDAMNAGLTEQSAEKYAMDQLKSMTSARNTAGNMNAAAAAFPALFRGGLNFGT